MELVQPLILQIRTFELREAKKMTRVTAIPNPHPPPRKCCDSCV
jgi:hypothetical protein